MTAQEIIDNKSAYESLGFTVLATKEFEDQIQAAKDTVTRGIAEKMEQTVKDTTGVQKNPNEKYYDYNLRVMKDLMDVKAEYAAKKNSLTGEGIEVYKTEAEKLRLDLAQAKADAISETEKLKASFFIQKVDGHFTAAVENFRSRIKKQDGLDMGVVFSALTSQAKRDILSTHDPIEVDGVFGFVLKGQTPERYNMLKDQQTGAVLGFPDLIMPKLRGVINPQEQKTVTGAGGANAKEKPLVAELRIAGDMEAQTAMLSRQGISPLSREGQELLIAAKR